MSGGLRPPIVKWTLTYDASDPVRNVGLLTTTLFPRSSTAVHRSSASVIPSSKFQLVVTDASCQPLADSQ